MIYVAVIFNAILFLITTIANIIHSVWNYSVVAPPLQPEHIVEIGINNVMLRTWPTLTYAEARTQDPRAIDAGCCSICLVNYDEEEGEDKALRLLPECGHLFHATCVDLWLRHRRTCPVCRSLVVNGAMQMPSPEVIPFEIDQI